MLLCYPQNESRRARTSFGATPGAVITGSFFAVMVGAADVPSWTHRFDASRDIPSGRMIQ